MIPTSWLPPASEPFSRSLYLQDRAAEETIGQVGNQANASPDSNSNLRSSEDYVHVTLIIETSKIA